MWVADADGLMTTQSTNAIGNEAVSAPITATDDITCPGGSGTDGSVKHDTLREKRFLVGVEDQFRAPFGGTIGIMAAHRIVFPVAPDPFPVFIAFIASDVNENFDAGSFADGLKYIDCAADIRIKSQFRFFERETDEGLGSKVKDKFRLIFLEGFDQPIVIADISMNMRYFLPQFSGVKIIGLARRIKGVANNIRP